MPNSSKRQSFVLPMMGLVKLLEASGTESLPLSVKTNPLPQSFGFYSPPVLLYVITRTCKCVALVPKSEQSLWQAKGKKVSQTKTCLSALGEGGLCDNVVLIWLLFSVWGYVLV